MRRWKVLSLILVAVLAASLGYGIYRSFETSEGSDDNWNNNSPAVTLNGTSDVNSTWLNFTFTWSPDAQKIVPSEFRLKVSVCLYTYSTLYGISQKRMWMLIEANDDEYNDWDYIGLVFDTNRNGYIDVSDEAYGAYANNMTQPAFLCDDGFLAFAEMAPIRGPQHVRFNPDMGYTFSINFPCGGYEEWDPLQSLESGCDNPLHICFLDSNAGGVFARFLFYVPEE
jgi:hypothetical protein